MSIQLPSPDLSEYIYFVRDQKVMLDEDLARLYGVTTKALVQAVKRNITRFPGDFMFQLSDQEVAILRSQIVTSRWGGRRTLPFAFSEQGIAMLSSVLRSEQAIQVNIHIMRAFVHLRVMLGSNAILSKRLDEIERKYDSQFKIVFDAIRSIMEPSVSPKKRKIGFARDSEPESA